jgi:hypothetical protein
MAPWDFHKTYPSIDFENIPGYPNKFNVKWSKNYPKYEGDQSLVITHVVKFLKYMLWGILPYGLAS